MGTYLLRVNQTAYGCEQDRRAQPSDDVNERRDFWPQHFGLKSVPQLAYPVANFRIVKMLGVDLSATVFARRSARQ
jgi:hypothetical protein